MAWWSPRPPFSSTASAALASVPLALGLLPKLEFTRAHGLEAALPVWLAARVVTLTAPGPAMLRVPGGRFVMGSSLQAIMGAAELCQREAPTEVCRPRAFASEQFQHTVELSGFWLDRTEVTVVEYDRCVEQHHCSAPPYAAGADRFRKSEYPVSLVSWDDARKFCSWRGARLPTEAEFERASRGSAGRQFPWGDLYNSRVSNHGRYGVADTDGRDGFEELAPVASYPDGRTPDGFVDLAGNVAEWVSDRYAPRLRETNATEPSGAKRFVDRRAPCCTRGPLQECSRLAQRGCARQPAAGAALPSPRVSLCQIRALTLPCRKRCS